MTMPLRRFLSLIPTACIALACCAAPSFAHTAASGLPEPVVPDGFGVNIHFTHFQPDQFQLFKDAGFGLVRMDLRWENVEKSLGSYDFSAFDTLLAELDRTDARALLILDFWNPLYDGGMAPHTQAGRDAFAAYAAKAAARYASRGVIWEIWNEPNSASFWKPAPNVADYGMLVKETVRAMRKADPRATILAGATGDLSTPWVESFLRTGAMAGVDGFSVHPYRQTNPETAAKDYDRIRALLARYTPPGSPIPPIVCSEWGYSTATSREWSVSESAQAAFILREYLWNIASGVDLTIFYDWTDDGSNPADSGDRYGILTQNLRPKPAYASASGLIRELRGYRFRHRLAATQSMDCRLLFEGPADLAVVEWSSQDNGRSPAPPTVRKVRPGDGEFTHLRRIASIRYSEDLRLALTSPEIGVDIRIANPENNPARIVIASGATRRQLAVPAHADVSTHLDLACDATTTDARPIDLSFTWNGEPVLGIAPVACAAVSVLGVTSDVRGADSVVGVTNTRKTNFEGWVRFRQAGHPAAEKPLSLTPGETKEIVFPNAAARAALIDVVDGSGLLWGRGETYRYAPVLNWPQAPGQNSGYTCVSHADAGTASTGAAVTLPAGDDAPAPAAVALPYESGPAAPYSTLDPDRVEPIPDDARALLLWVKSDGVRPYLRVRFTDASGQEFQVDSGAIAGDGWRRVTFGLDGQGAAYSGGAGDGVPHGSRRWENIALVDAHGESWPVHRGTVLFCNPTYAMR